MLLPGDPGRALLLAQSLLEAPAMFNHHRGLWGYTGRTAEGVEVTIQSTGMGGPSAAIVIAELAELGARRLIRVGTCGGLDSRLALGGLVVVDEALAEDGVGRALADGRPLRPDPELRSALTGAAGPQALVGPVVSTDLFYDTPPGQANSWRERGAVAVEMETATLFALAARRGLQTAALLLVSDLLSGDRVRISQEELRAAEPRLGEVGLLGLLSAGRPA